MSDPWFVARGGVQKGPIDHNTFLRLIEFGKVRPDDQVWRKGMTAWLPCSEVPELARMRKAEVTVQTQPPALMTDSIESSPDNNPASTPRKKPNPQDETLAMIALLAPMAASALIWFWVGKMNLLHNPSASLNLVGYGTVIAIGILIGIEASRLGIGGVTDIDSRGRRRRNGPVNWAAFTMLFFIAGFPAYMAIRARYGVRNHCAVSILSMLFFLISWSAMAGEISKRIAGG
jgi:hypothetical protein